MQCVVFGVVLAQGKVGYAFSLAVVHHVTDEHSACWISIRLKTLSDGDVKFCPLS